MTLKSKTMDNQSKTDIGGGLTTTTKVMLN